jgi:L-iditol 2-dehydrogenase
LGHEGVGIITESLNESFRTGTMVALYPGLFCGKCERCGRGLTAQCEKIKIRGFNEDGFFRSALSFTEGELPFLIPIADEFDPEYAALAEPLACCIHAVGKFDLPEKKRALVIGAGAVGSMFASLLKAGGWEKVIVADTNSRRLSSELPDGVEVIDLSASGISECLKNERIDFVVAACPDGLGFPFWEIMNIGGCVSFFSGNRKGKESYPIDMNAVHYKELVISGSYGCDIGDFHKAVDMLAGRHIDLDFFRFYRVPLERISDGMKALGDHEVKKVIINSFYSIKGERFDE